MVFYDANVLVADYLIQVNLIYKKSYTQVRGSFNVWKKGGMFGMGDELMRWCPKHACLGLFEFGFALFPEEEERIGNTANVAIKDWPEDIKVRHDTWYEGMDECPQCHLVSPRMRLCDSYGFNTTLDVIATRMVDIFRVLGDNADIYLVRTVEDRLLHRAKEELRDTVKPNMKKYTDLLKRARDREQVFYPLKSVIKDSQDGNLRKRFQALLRA